mmetsp:Transcript_110651/g.312942  ORF Transcript_110651/g.312942 Transcript_110651/m.312942 type:complete len:391 (-) Transcript_110651:517-1689(-)
MSANGAQGSCCARHQRDSSSVAASLRASPQPCRPGRGGTGGVANPEPCRPAVCAELGRGLQLRRPGLRQCGPASLSGAVAGCACGSPRRTSSLGAGEAAGSRGPRWTATGRTLVRGPRWGRQPGRAASVPAGSPRQRRGSRLRGCGVPLLGPSACWGVGRRPAACGDVRDPGGWRRRATYCRVAAAPPCVPPGGGCRGIARRHARRCTGWRPLGGRSHFCLLTPWTRPCARHHALQCHGQRKRCSGGRPWCDRMVVKDAKCTRDARPVNLRAHVGGVCPGKGRSRGRAVAEEHAVRGHGPVRRRVLRSPSCLRQGRRRNSGRALAGSHAGSAGGPEHVLPQRVDRGAWAGRERRGGSGQARVARELRGRKCCQLRARCTGLCCERSTWPR